MKSQARRKRRRAALLLLGLWLGVASAGDTDLFTVTTVAVNVDEGGTFTARYSIQTLDVQVSPSHRGQTGACGTTLAA